MINYAYSRSYSCLYTIKPLNEWNESSISRSSSLKHVAWELINGERVAKSTYMYSFIEINWHNVARAKYRPNDVFARLGRLAEIHFLVIRWYATYYEIHVWDSTGLFLTGSLYWVTLVHQFSCEYICIGLKWPKKTKMDRSRIFWIFWMIRSDLEYVRKRESLKFSYRGTV